MVKMTVSKLGVLSEYKGDVSELHLPEDIKSIKNDYPGIFEDHTELTDVFLNEGLKRIGDRAFAGCVGLKNIVIPEGVTYIGDDAFENCRSLKSITIPDSVTEISGGAFSGCTGLQEIKLSKNLNYLGSNIFEDCTRLKEITIPENMEAIEFGSFDGCTGLRSISFPKKIKMIGERAFYGCSGLKTVTFPENLKHIFKYAFAGCSGLSKIKFPYNLEFILDHAFERCEKLTEIDLPKNIKRIGRDAFDRGSNLLINGEKFCVINGSLVTYTGNDPEVVIPNGTLYIENDLFSDHEEITSLVIPDGVTHIGKRAFKNCKGLTSLEIPEGVLIIESEAFSGCRNLKNVTIPGSIIKIGSRFEEDIFHVPESDVFFGCLKSKLKLHVYENSAAMEYAQNQGWKYKIIKNKEKAAVVQSDENSKTMETLTDLSVRLFDGDIPNDGFLDFKHEDLVIDFEAAGTMYDGRTENIEDVKAGDPIQVVRDPENTYNPNNFRLLTEQGKDVGNMPAEICNAMACHFDHGRLFFTDVKASYVEPLSKRGKSAKKGILFIELHCGPGNEKKARPVIEEIIPDKIEKAPEMIPEDRSDKDDSPAGHPDENISPEGAAVFTAGSGSQFEIDGTTLVSYTGKAAVVEIPEGITEIGPKAFLKKDFITEVFLPDSLMKIGGWAFGHCKKLTSVRIPDAVRSIGIHAFRNCIALEHVDFPENLEYLGHHAFNYCEKLEEAVVKGNIKAIEEETFDNCHSLKSVKMPDSVKKIGSGAFWSCPALEQVELSKNLEKIGVSAFTGCKQLKNIVFPDSLKEIGTKGFISSGLTSILLPKSLIKLGEYCFACCRNLKDAEILGPVREIPQHSFASGGITRIKLPDGLRSIAKYAFTDMYGLSENLLRQIYIPGTVSEIDNWAFGINPELEIYCPKGSYAEEYAKGRNYKAVTEPEIIASVFSEEETVAAVEAVSGIQITEETASGQITEKPDPLHGQTDPTAAESAQDGIISEPEIIPRNGSTEFAPHEEDTESLRQAAENLNDSPEKGLEPEISYSENSVGRSDEPDPGTNLSSRKPETASSPADQKTAWIRYQASEVAYSGRASAYFFFDLRNEMTIGNYDWQSGEFLKFYLKYFPGMNEGQMAQLRMQAIPWLNDPNTCNAQYQIIMQDTFEHRYVMIASAWFARAVNYDPVSRVQFIYNSCRSFFYPQEQQTVWQRLCSEAGL